jgi:hypothetical protein
MDKLSSLSLVGFPGNRVIEVMIGGELVLDLSLSLFSFPQDRIPIREREVRRRIQVLMSGQNPVYSITKDEKIEIFFFFMSLSEMKWNKVPYTFIQNKSQKRNGNDNKKIGSLSENHFPIYWDEDVLFQDLWDINASPYPNISRRISSSDRDDGS